MKEIFLPGFLGNWTSFLLPENGEFWEGIAALLHWVEGHYGPGPHDWVGYSMGGRLALAIAVWYPEWVSKLTLISASPGLEDPVARSARYAADLQLADRLETEPLSEFLRSWYDQQIFTSLKASPNFESVMRERLKIDPHFQAQLMRVFSVGHQPSFWEALPALAFPVKLMTGDLDPHYTQIAQRMCKLNPKFEWRRVPGVGHALLQEAH